MTSSNIIAYGGLFNLSGRPVNNVIPDARDSDESENDPKRVKTSQQRKAYRECTREKVVLFIENIYGKFLIFCFENNGLVYYLAKQIGCVTPHFTGGCHLVQDDQKNFPCF